MESMINFKIKLTKEEAAKWQNRKVEYVSKSTSLHPTFGKFSTWVGALENEYFTILFLGGVIILSVAEREFILGQNNLVFAEATSLLQATELIKGSTPEIQQDIQNQYNTIVSLQEQNEITFNNLMSILNWQYTDESVVDETDLLGV